MKLCSNARKKSFNSCSSKLILVSIIVFGQSLAAKPQLSREVYPQQRPVAFKAAMLRGNPQRSGVLATRGLDTLPQQVIWKSERLFRLRAFDSANLTIGPFSGRIDIPTNQGFTLPIISDGVAYFVFSTNTNAYLYAIDARTGKTLTTFRFQNNELSAPAAIGRTVFVGSATGRVHALDVDKGSVKWAFEEKGISFANAEPIIEDDVIYFSGYNKGLIAFALENGEVKWKYNSKEALYGPAISGNDVVLTTSKEVLIAVNKETGEKKWEARINGTPSKPSILGNKIFLRRPSREIRAYSLTDGSLIWRAKVQGGAATALVLFKDSVIYGGLENNVIAVDAETGLEKWKFRTTSPCRFPIIAGEILYVTCGDKKLYALDPATGLEKWRYDNKKAPPPPPTVSDGIMYLLGTDGLMFALR